MIEAIILSDEELSEPGIYTRHQVRYDNIDGIGKERL